MALIAAGHRTAMRTLGVPTATERGPFTRGLVALVAPAAVFVAWIEAGPAGTVVGVDDIATAVAALVAAGFCARAAIRHSARRRLCWWLLAGASSAWMLGDTIWAVYDLFPAGDVPAASWADVGYLAAPPLAAAALLLHPAFHVRALATSRSLVDALLLAVAVFLPAWVFVLEPIQRTSDLTSLDGLVTIAYPLGDVVIVFLVVLMIGGTTERDRRELWCLLAGLLAISISDAAYSYLTRAAEYASGNVIDSGFFVGYLAIAFGAAWSRSDNAVEPREISERSLTSAAIVMPFLPILGALILVALRIGLGYRLDGVALTAAFVIVGLVLIRQTLLVIDLLSSGRPSQEGAPDRLLSALGAPVVAKPIEPA